MGSTDKLGVSRSSLNYSSIVCILRIYDRIWTEFNENVEGQKIKGNHWTQMRSWISKTIFNWEDHFSKLKDVSVIQRWSRKNDRHNLFPNLKVKNDCFSSDTIFRSLELSSIENVPFPFCAAAYFFLVLCPDFLARIQNLFSLKMVIKTSRRKNGLFLTQIT